MYPLPIHPFLATARSLSCETDVHCVAWLLYSSTYSDVIYSTVRFAADTIWYSEIARALSPHTLADLFFECLSDGRVVADKSDYAISIGMALSFGRSASYGPPLPS